MKHKLFVGGYSPANQPGLRAFEFDAADGTLAALGSLAGVLNPSFLVLHPTQPWLFAVSETESAADGVPGHVYALRYDPATLALEIINHQPSGGDWPCHVLLDATGRWLLVSNYGTGSVGVLPIGEDGSLGALAHLAQHEGSSGVNPERQEGPHAHSVGLTLDNQLFVVADLGLDQLAAYYLDTDTGALALHALAEARPGAGPRHMVFHPGGRLLYVANELDSTVSVFEYRAISGTFTEVEAHSTLPADAPENYVADIHISASGERLYVSNRGHNSLAVFDVREDGLLKRVAVCDCGGDWPRNFALSPDGGWVLCANQYSGGVAVLPVEQGERGLGAPRAGAVAAGASCVRFLETSA